MLSFRLVQLLSVILLIASIDGVTQGQAPQPTSLPPGVRELGARLLIQGTPTRERLDLIEEIAGGENPAVLPFLIAMLERENDPEVQRALVGVIAQFAVPNARTAIEAFERKQRGSDVARFAADHVSILEEEQSPTAFFAAAPPAIIFKAPSGPVRFLVIGDFGTSGGGPTDMQEQVAAAIKKFHASSSPQVSFGVTVGDNFYPLGVNGDKDPRWKSDWITPYGGLGIRFYPTLGNHDHYGGSASVQGQVKFKHDSWEMPASYYTLKVGNVELFAMDTEKISNKQQRVWLEKALLASTATWKIPVGHHPVISGGKHGVNGELQKYRDILRPLFKKASVPLYLAGHDHDMQFLSTDGLYQAVIGGSGKDTRPVVRLNESLFCTSGNGFVVIEAGDATLRVQFYRAPDATSAYDCTLTRKTDGTVTEACESKCS